MCARSRSARCLWRVCAGWSCDEPPCTLGGHPWGPITLWLSAGACVCRGLAWQGPPLPVEPPPPTCPWLSTKRTGRTTPPAGSASCTKSELRASGACLYGQNRGAPQIVCLEPGLCLVLYALVVRPASRLESPDETRAGTACVLSVGSFVSTSPRHGAHSPAPGRASL